MEANATATTKMATAADQMVVIMNRKADTMDKFNKKAVISIKTAEILEEAQDYFTIKCARIMKKLLAHEDIQFKLNISLVISYHFPLVQTLITIIVIFKH